MSFFITVVTGGPAQVFIFPMRWLVAGTIISCLNYVNSSGRGGVLRHGAARVAIATIPIAPTFLVILARSLDLGGLGAMRRHGLCLVRVEQKGTLVPVVIFDSFWGGAVALGITSIYLTDSERKVQGGFASAVIAFLIAWSYVFFWGPSCSAWAQMDGLRTSWNR